MRASHSQLEGELEYYAHYILVTSERAKRESISSVQIKSAIYMYLYVCIYACMVFYGTFTCPSTNNMPWTVEFYTRRGKKRKQIKEKA